MPRTYVSYIVIIKSITRYVIKRWSNSVIKEDNESIEIMKTIDEKEMQKTTKDIRKEMQKKDIKRKTSKMTSKEECKKQHHALTHIILFVLK